MKRIFISAAALLAAAVSQAQAADQMSKAGVPAGTWCLIEAPAESGEGWQFFERSRKCVEATLILKANGDYVLFDDSHEQRCRVDPKSYFKGWADYTCTFVGGGINVTKRNQKFTSHPPGQIGLSTMD